jgi:hypothetical protein
MYGHESDSPERSHALTVIALVVIASLALRMAAAPATRPAGRWT